MRSVWSGLYAVVPVLLLASAAFAITGPGRVQPTGWRPSVGQYGNCPILYLTDTYALTVAHCADSNGVGSGDFDYINRADVPGMTLRYWDQSGQHTKSNVTAKVILHPSITPGVNPSDGKHDIAMYRFISDKFDITDDMRSRHYISGMSYPGCLLNTKGRQGAATWPAAQDIERIDSDQNYCTTSNPLCSTCEEITNFNSSGLATGARIDYENGDSGGATYLTTTITRKPAYTGLMHAGTTGDTNNEYATALTPKATWIMAQDTNLGGPSLSSWVTTLDIGGQTVSVRYYTDSSE